MKYDWKIYPPYKLYKPNIQAENLHFKHDKDDNYHYIYVCKKGVLALFRFSSRDSPIFPNEGFLYIY